MIASLVIVVVSSCSKSSSILLYIYIYYIRLIILVKLQCSISCILIFEAADGRPPTEQEPLTPTHEYSMVYTTNNMCMYIYIYIYICICVCICVYTRIHMHMCILRWPTIWTRPRMHCVRVCPSMNPNRHASIHPSMHASMRLYYLSTRYMHLSVYSHRWNRNPRPQPQKFSTLAFRMRFS